MVRFAHQVNFMKKRPTQMRPLTPKVLDEFIDTERPQGALTAAYGRCVATLRDPKYPKQALELAMRIDGEGVGHYDRFREVKRALGAYAGKNAAFPYLRPLTETRNNGTTEALALFETILDTITEAYVAESTGNHAAAEAGVGSARETMLLFKRKAETLARDGFGIPLLDARQR